MTVAGDWAKRYRFFKAFFFKAECQLCRAVTKRSGMNEHAEWHALRGEHAVLDGGTVRGFCDVSVRRNPNAPTLNTGWVTTGTGPG